MNKKNSKKVTKAAKVVKESEAKVEVKIRKEDIKRRWVKEGWIVIGDVTSRGCVSYSCKDREEEIKDDRLDAEWNTHKTVTSVEEQETLQRECGKARRSLANLGTHMGVFHFVPEDKGDELEKVLEDIRLTCLGHNQAARYTRLTPNFIVYRVEGTDARVAKVLYDRLIELADKVATGLSNGDAKAVRWWLKNLEDVRNNIPTASEVGGKIDATIEVMRKAAKEAVEKAKEAAKKGDNGKESELVKKISAGPIEGLRASLVEATSTVEAIADKLNLPAAAPRQIE